MQSRLCRGLLFGLHVDIQLLLLLGHTLVEAGGAGIRV